MHKGHFNICARIAEPNKVLTAKNSLLHFRSIWKAAIALLCGKAVSNTYTTRLVKLLLLVANGTFDADYHGFLEAISPVLEQMGSKSDAIWTMVVEDPQFIGWTLSPDVHELDRSTIQPWKLFFE